MTNHGWGLFRLGLKRRKKDVRRLKIMMALAVFFLAFTLLFQDNMNAYQMEINYDQYGSWFLRTVSDEFADHPYLCAQGYAIRGSIMYAGRSTSEIRTGEASAGDISYEEYLSAFYAHEGEIPFAFEQQHGGVGNRLDFIGAFSEDFAEVNRLKLLSGRWPSSDDEIVMTIPSLQRYGYSMELGQEISFYLVSDYLAPFSPAFDRPDSTNFMFPASFRLVGIMEAYTDIWDGGETSELPHAIVTEKALTDLDMITFTSRFYAIREEFQTDNVWAFAAELADGITDSERYGKEVTSQNANEIGNRTNYRYYTINRAAFQNTFWGNSTMYYGMTGLLVLLGAAISAYLYASYLSRRRVYFLRLREIGASASEVWKMAAFECVLSVLPAAGITLTVSYLLSVIAVLGVSLGTKIRFFYVFSLKTLGMILLSFLLILALALLMALLIFTGRGITEKRKGLSRFSVRRLFRRAKRAERKKKGYLGIRETLKREKKTRPLQVGVTRFLGVAVVAVLLFCVGQIQTEVENYRRLSILPVIEGSYGGYVQKWTYNIPVTPYINTHGRTKDTREVSREAIGFTSRNVMKEAFLETVSEVPGVKNIVCVFRDFTHTFSWENKETDAFYLAYRDLLAKIFGTQDIDLSNPKIRGFYKLIEPILYSIVCYEDAARFDLYKNAFAPDVYDEAAFMNGEQAVLLVDTALMNLSPVLEESEIKSFSSIPAVGIRTGDTIYIETKGEKVAVRVAALSTATASDASGMLTLVAAPALARRLADADNYDFGYNWVGISLQENADMIGTAEMLTSLFTSQSAAYTNRTETFENQRESIRRTVFTYGVFALILVLLFLLVTDAVSEDEELRRAPRYRQLSRMGMDKRRLERGKRRDALFESLFLLLAVPISFLQPLAQAREYFSPYDQSNFPLPVYLGEKLVTLTSAKDIPLYTVKHALINWEPWSMLLTALVFAAVVFLIRVRTLKSSQEVKENGR